MRLDITRDGKSATVEVDISLDKMKGQEWERVHEVVDGDDDPKLMRAMIWAKLLHTPFSDVAFDEVDYDLSELAAFAETIQEKAWTAEESDAVVIPMETTTGTVEAEVDIG